ncbi:MAG: katanin p60 ATPase-containing subunit A1 [Candidatus Argoarchaeum ethanivorans]|uniref:Katanin p60 ATPase-containing subunit A1 n=1 Tax=Candidatus Argoarchaeum ethanivorans TaxID=2608793 RepID=A0A8B3S2R5_9EURY|nr:MAG: katanin p60 ATPase-containing subunit A1 [Candidatus Argoarchaeum ethanivorans]
MNQLLEQEYLNKINESKENAKKHYDSGAYDKASEEYLNCSKYCEILVKKTGDETKKKEYYDAFEKFVDTSVKLKKMKAVGVREAKKERERPEAEAGTGFEQYIKENLMQRNKETLPLWEDIGGLEETKNTIKESIVLAYARKPDRVEIDGWRNILLFGPPGTGKTLLAAATAEGLDAAFFNVKAGQVLSKYYGESPKIVNALFDVAREESPAVIFFDELDSVALSRSAEIDEATRRVLSSLLTELDGLSGGKKGEFVLFLASTNTPWDIDGAVISRFEKRIYVPLPDEDARKGILKIQLEKKGFEFAVYDWLVEKTDGYSGRDIKVLCKGGVYNMVRDLNPGVADLAEEGLEEIKKYEIKTRGLTKKDFEQALKSMKPTSTEDMVKKYEEWDARFGAL